MSKIPLSLAEISELFRPSSVLKRDAVQVVIIDNKRRIVISGMRDAYGVVTLKTVPETSIPPLPSPLARACDCYDDGVGSVLGPSCTLHRSSTC